MAAAPSSSPSELGRDVWLPLLASLPLSDAANLALTCRALRAFFDEDAHWKARTDARVPEQAARRAREAAAGDGARWRDVYRRCMAAQGADKATWRRCVVRQQRNDGQRGLPGPRELHAAAPWPDGGVLVVGGWRGGVLDNGVFLMLPSASSPVEVRTHRLHVKGTPPAPRYGHSLTPCGDGRSFLLTGGFLTGGYRHALGDCVVLRPREGGGAAESPGIPEFEWHYPSVVIVQDDGTHGEPIENDRHALDVLGPGRGMHAATSGSAGLGSAPSGAAAAPALTKRFVYIHGGVMPNGEANGHEGERDLYHNESNLVVIDTASEPFVVRRQDTSFTTTWPEGSEHSQSGIFFMSERGSGAVALLDTIPPLSSVGDGRMDPVEDEARFGHTIDLCDGHLFVIGGAQFGDDALRSGIDVGSHVISLDLASMVWSRCHVRYHWPSLKAWLSQVRLNHDERTKRDDEDDKAFCEDHVRYVLPRLQASARIPWTTKVFMFGGFSQLIGGDTNRLLWLDLNPKLEAGDTSDGDPEWRAFGATRLDPTSPPCGISRTVLLGMPTHIKGGTCARLAACLTPLLGPSESQLPSRFLVFGGFRVNGGGETDACAVLDLDAPRGAKGQDEAGTSAPEGPAGVRNPAIFDYSFTFDHDAVQLYGTSDEEWETTDDDDEEEDDEEYDDDDDDEEEEAPLEAAPEDVIDVNDGEDVD